LVQRNFLDFLLIYLIKHEKDRLLCVFNLSAFAQPVEIDLEPFNGSTPIEIIGVTLFPVIGELPYLLTPNGYGNFLDFYTKRLYERESPLPTKGPFHTEKVLFNSV
jgi:hypothetical protein